MDKKLNTKTAVPEDEESLVLGKAMMRAARYLKISNTEVAHILGLSSATISRLKTGEYRLERGSKAFELALLLVRVFRGLDAITGSDDASRSWIRAQNLALRNAPIDLMQTVTGLVGVAEYVDARRARV
ncbi:MAG: MbcA/ParS/Xre antitoxin family protein [Rhodospirillales bacterium]|jgi:uncharacterized protein (DUF2384 family)|nr:hypothetical protein [Rhodospirillaceae bacterium]MDP6426571.1 MbcA/ParS/Xre antitoxin family protein [Rhodospirillales bacterium]MDP6644056.1 MbcA/ParS/Xre antitoxin family protein [Rhodospirillales bacterium]MDP6843173.1 MbcA/ParS/Xre antitoxin family protein [Rhodospirillales bacterium]|tara:strand:- start:411 stop:797 length:387 start_codon:yes stop_codon:yes gene_type:complete